jgi:uncharacterized membrane protein YkoI
VSKFIKGAVALSIVGVFAIASNSDIEVNDDDSKDIQIKSSLQISDNSSEMDEKIAAKIGAEDVARIIKSKILGKIINIKLENENGNLIYSVEILKENGKITDAFVDAGNGKILALIADKKDTQEESDEKDDKEES